MAEPIFADKSHQPDDADLADTLGRAKRHWDTLVAHVQQASPAATAEWKFYTAKYGWTFVVREKRRNLFYLKPLAKCFTVSLAFGDKAVDAAEQSDLPDEIVKPIRQSPKLPEGRAVRINVTSASHVAIAKKLLAIKAAN
jgi:hypothetical protein